MASSRGRVLVIDDEPDLVQALAMRLGKAGYEVLSAFDGAQGLELARSREPQVILLDILLPGPSGYAICEQLKGANSTWDIPVVLLRGDVQPEARRRAREAGCFSFVTKPYNPVELIETVEHAMGRQTGRH